MSKPETFNENVPQWPLRGRVIVRDGDEKKWRFTNQKLGIEDRPCDWMREHPEGNIYQAIIDDAIDRVGRHEMVGFEVTEDGYELLDELPELREWADDTDN